MESGHLETMFGKEKLLGQGCHGPSPHPSECHLGQEMKKGTLATLATQAPTNPEKFCSSKAKHPDIPEIFLKSKVR